ncbi:MAG: TLD-domain-containing protein [Benjaminiella poitrasii]|nr:MAG: TLD-domain-containing protein [Benjaminiella poitrasii]
MGNSQSQSKNKEQQLLSEWTPEEQQKLNQQLENRTSLKLPKYFSTDLYDFIETFLHSYKKKSQVDYLQLLHGLLKSKDSAAAYLVFHHCQPSITLKTFVFWIVQSAIPLWFEGGNDQAYFDVYGKEHSASLVDYLLYSAKEKERQQKESMSWLLDSNDSNLQENNKSWEAKVQQHELTETEFLEWYERTSGIQSLFQLVIEFIVFGKVKTTESLEHQRRLHHLASPSIQQPDKEMCKLLGKEHYFSRLMTPYDYYMLTLHLPQNALSWAVYERKTTEDVKHELLFSSRRDGTSWQVFVGKMVGQGATLVLVKAKDGSIFGGYADEAWQYANTGWYGNASNFLFRLKESYGAWEGGHQNDHFQYLCWGKKSLPNGFGMGGQFDYAGLWIDSDFIHGHSRAGPLCTTYGSPQLPMDQEFLIDEVEVWLVKPLQKDDTESDTEHGKGVLNYSEDMEFMEMAGKKMYSKDLGPEKEDDNNDA